VNQDPEEMDADRFHSLALSYGAKIARWPAGEQKAAEAFLAQHPESARFIDEQRRIDEQLDALMPEEPSPHLLRSVAEIPLLHAKALGGTAWWPLARLRNAVAVAAAAAAMGAAVGMITPEQPDVADAQESWDELSGMAFALDLSEELSP
jgi:hypothetical protein